MSLKLRKNSTQRTGLYDVGEFEKTSARNRSQIEKLMLKITTKSQIETRLPELMPYRITNVHFYSVRPNIAKPHVACRFSSTHCPR